MQRMAPRIGLLHPTATLRVDAARARVQGIWKQHPEITGNQVIARLGLKHLLGIARARALLKECRRAAAKQSPAHQKVGWWLDNRTAVRIRIWAIWKRHPELTARRVLEMLGPEQGLRLNWVRHILSDCRRGAARRRHGGKELLVGHSLYGKGRGWLGTTRASGRLNSQSKR